MNPKQFKPVYLNDIILEANINSVKSLIGFNIPIFKNKLIVTQSELFNYPKFNFATLFFTN